MYQERYVNARHRWITLPPSEVGRLGIGVGLGVVRVGLVRGGPREGLSV